MLSFVVSPVDLFFIAVTLAGSEVFLTAVVLAVYWCNDRVAGLRLGVVFLLSMWLNSVLKLVFKLPRPAPHSGGAGAARPYVVLGAEGYGFPSGHTQGTATLWWMLAGLFRRRFMAAAAAVATVLVGASRMYLGVHYLEDVVGGGALGIAVAIAAVASFRWLDRSGRRVTRPVLVIAALVLPALMLTGPVDESVMKSSGFFLGFALGGAVEPALCGFRRPAGLRTQAARVALGLGCVLAVGGIIELVAPATPSWVWLRYATTGLSATLLVPWVFVLVGLAAPEGAAS